MKYEFKVPGMMCNGCVKAVTNALNEIDGVTKVNINLDSKLVKVESNKEIEEEVFKKTLLKIGFRLEK